MWSLWRQRQQWYIATSLLINSCYDNQCRLILAVLRLSTPRGTAQLNTDKALLPQSIKPWTTCYFSFSPFSFFCPCLMPEPYHKRRGSLLLTLHLKKIKKICEVTTPSTKNAKPIFEFKSISIDDDNKQVIKMQNILACPIFWWAIGAFSRPPLGIFMPYALWHCCLLCWGLQVTIYFDKSIVIMLLVPSWRWPWWMWCPLYWLDERFCALQTLQLASKRQN